MRTVPALAGLLASFALLAAPAAAQDGAEDVQLLLEQGIDHLTHGNELLKKAKALQGAEADRARADASASFEEGCAKYARVLEIIAPLDLPDEQKAEVRSLCHYNTACGRSLQGKKDEALVAFGAAVDAGFDDWDHIAKDADLDGIRQEPRFVQIVERARAAAKEAAAAEARAALSPDAMFPYDFKVTTLAGKQLQLADLKGKVALVVFWGSWNAPSREQLPILAQLKKEQGDKLELVCLAWEHGQGGEGATAKVAQLAQEAGLGEHLALVTDRAELQKVPDFRVFPTLLFIDKQGRVRAKLATPTELDGLKSIAAALEAEAGDKPADEPATPPQGGGTPF